MLSMIVLGILVVLMTVMANAGWKIIRGTASRDCRTGRSEYIANRQGRI